jgi:predicted glycosyltransferase
MVPPVFAHQAPPLADLPGRAKRVLVYSHDTFGLGNIRRMLEISRHLVESDPEMSVLIISGSPMLHAFRIPQRIDYLKLPCLARDTQGSYGAKFLPLSADETARLRSNLIKSAVLDFRPDLILVDKKPFGVKDELASTLEALGGLAQRPRMMLLLRDILDSPESTIPVWKRNGYFEAIDAYYDEVLVVGTADIYDLRREYDFPPLAAAKVRFCGYIAKSEPLRSRAAMRAQLGLRDDRPMVLVTPGGGEDGWAVVRNALDAQAHLDPALGIQTLIVCGPEMNAEQREEIETRAKQFPAVSVLAFSDQMMSLMNAADLAVCMGGYNTVTELLTLRRRAIIVPRVQPVQEQWIRAERLARRGLVHALHPSECTPESLARAIEGELAREVHGVSTHRIDLHGLERIAAAVQTQLTGEPLPRSRIAHLDARPARTAPPVAAFDGERAWLAS